MTTVVRQGMIEDGAYYTQAEAYALFRTPFIGSYVDLAYEPDPVTQPELLPCYGQTVLTADYPALFAKLGTRYGGNGTTTFGIPDVRGRVRAGLDDMGGTSANRLTNLSGGVEGDTVGSVGGSEKHTLTTDEMPTHDHDGDTETDGTHSHAQKGSGAPGATTTAQYSGSLSSAAVQTTTTATDGAHEHHFTTDTAGGGGAHNNVQPTIVSVVCILAK